MVRNGEADVVNAVLLVAAAVALAGFPRLRRRLQLSRAKHRSLQGHPRISRFLARLVPFYEYDDETFFRSDGAPADIAGQRRAGFDRLAGLFRDRSPNTRGASESIEVGLSDLQFTSSYRVPFQYSRYVKRRLPIGSLLGESCGVLVKDLDGNAAYDLTGSYGVNLFGYDFYKECIDAGIERVRPLGPLLGSYHPIVEDNIRVLTSISGLDEVSFHMSGTEAVMQGVRLARYHTGRSHLVVFSGAYHGWWDGVQPGAGNPRPVGDVYTLKEVDDDTLRVLESRRDIACVLVNPLQSLHPNAGAPSDATLVAGDRGAHFDHAAYARWLQRLRDVCTRRNIVLIFDEVFVGFRIARRGAQEYFGVDADMVTYGKTVGGGLPVGVLCGRRDLMKRYRDDRPSDICFARGTFNSHPYVMAAMNEFLRRFDELECRQSYAGLTAQWNARAGRLNERLAREGLPVSVANLVSIWTICYATPSRYHWMFQYYLRAEGLALSWIGTGRLVFSHNYTDADFEAVVERFLVAARRMQADGWWWHTPEMTSRSIKRQVLRELVAARLRPARSITSSAARPSDRRARLGAAERETGSTA
jgi:glutamate-1-semialdehyde 2,1-aminomutase